MSFIFASLISGWSSKIIACTNGPDGLTRSNGCQLTEWENFVAAVISNELNSENWAMKG